MRKLCVLLGVLGLAACARAAPDGAPTPSREGVPEDVPGDVLEDWPAGTIERPAGVFHVPVGRDSTGCVQYQTKIPGRMTAQVIKYRTKDGAFTANRREAACPPR